ncbi:MAG: HAD family hydrolase [Polyangiaceae bacterium]
MPSFAIALPSLPLTVTVVTAIATVAIGAVLALESRFSFVAALVASAALAAAVVWLVEHARRLHEREAHATLANKGVTFRDRAAWDAARRTTRVAFAFRGSLVTPEPDLLTTETTGGASEAAVLARVAAALDVARHPFAAPLRRAMAPRVPEVVACTSAETTVDHGVVATFVTGETLAIGPRAFLVGRGVGVSAVDARATSFEEAGRVVLVVAENDTVVGLVVFADALRGGARGAVQRLLDARVEPVLLSHDPVEPATVLARALDVDHVRAAIPADGEDAAVRALDDTGHTTAVIADPTVASTALLASSLPVALGGDVATFAAATDRTDPRDAVDAVLLPKAAHAKARRDAIVFAAVPVASVFATALGILPLRYVPLSVFVSLAVFVATIRRGPRGSAGADDAVMSRAPRL